MFYLSHYGGEDNVICFVPTNLLRKLRNHVYATKKIMNYLKNLNFTSVEEMI